MNCDEGVQHEVPGSVSGFVALEMIVATAVLSQSSAVHVLGGM